MARTIETRRLSFSLGAGLALLFAVLFGASTPLAEGLGSIEPWLLAAALYLGSGVGLFVVRSALGARRSREVVAGGFSTNIDRSSTFATHADQGSAAVGAKPYSRA